jgi:PLP dependent protein
VRLVAVTKGLPAETVTAAVSAGLRDIGESRVQEAQAKRGAVAVDARWHMIGHLQRNKARVAAGLFDVIQSVDRVDLAAALDRHRDQGAPPLPVLLEVELTGLPRRNGVPPAGAAAVLGELLTLHALAPVGLMTVAAPGPSAADCFIRLRELGEQLRQSHGAALPELSMGMSDDFEVAIAQGATIIRLGRVLFGHRAAAGRPAPSSRLS